MNIFCSATWEEININLALRNVKYCCHSAPINFPNELTVDWLKNNSQIRERKQFMLDNKKHKDCSFCYNQEESSGTSIRFLKNKQELENSIRKNPRQDYAKKIEITFDNICNQSCIYCNENYSSLIAEERGISKKFHSYTNKDIKVIVDWLSNIETSRDNIITIRMLGGEPTASKNYFNLLDLLIKNCSTQYFQIHTITNCNTTDKGLAKIKSYLDKKTNWKWSFGISNESTNKISENIRYGLDWNRFDKCIRFYANNPNVFFITAVISSNIFTIKDMPNYFTYVDNIFKESKKDYGFAYNWVVTPDVLSPANLPETYKKYIDKTKELCISTTSNIHKESFLNYLTELKKIIGTKTPDKERLTQWLTVENAFKKNKLDIDLLLSQCEDT